jgi:hypothetical protein
MAPPWMAEPLEFRELQPKAKDIQGPRGSLLHRCGFCLKPGKHFKQCSGCGIVRHCTAVHWARHYPKHQTLCEEIKKIRLLQLPTERKLLVADIRLARALIRANTRDGVQATLEHLQRMFERHTRLERWWLIDRIPVLMLRLDQDQQGYECIKHWRLKVPPLNINPDETPYSTVGIRNAEPTTFIPATENADILEDVMYLEDPRVDLQHTTLILLLKMKLLQDIIKLKLTRKAVSTRTPPELWGNIDRFVVRSNISERWLGWSYGALTSMQQRLERQIQKLARIIQSKTAHFPYALLEPDPYLTVTTLYRTRGSRGDVAAILQYSYVAWWEHEGILELLQSARALAALDSADEVEKLIEEDTVVPRLTEQELLDDVSYRKLWTYFSEAVEDAFSLAEVKPSEIRREQRRLTRAALERIG